MNRSGFLHRIAIAVAAIALAGCGDQAPLTAPSSAPSAPQESLLSLLGGTQVTAVRWLQNPGALSVTGVIGTQGGTLSIPGADFSITFPAGAVSQPTTVTVNAIDGNFVAYDMLPHGITFGVPVKATQGLRNTGAYRSGLLGTGLLANVFGTYTASDVVPAANGTFKATEILVSQTVWSLINGLLQPDYQTWQINHFSRYMLASG
jgi:predicted small lipoprotein YifL